VLIEVFRESQTLIVTTEGRVDGATAREFHEALEAAATPEDDAVILDMAKLSYISSAGLRVILIIAKALQKQNSKFAVCALSLPIREVFQMSGFDKIIPVHDSRVDALAALRG